MWLNELRHRAQQRFPFVANALAALLAVWVEDDPQAPDALATWGLTPPAFRSTLEAYLSPPPLDADRELILSCIAGQSSGQVNGASLLRCLLTQTDHPLAVSLRRLGIAPIAPLTPAPQLTLAGQGMLADSNTPTLARFGRDLIALAKEEAFAALVPRTEAMRSLLDILLRKRKGNPVLTGSAGIGKTALVECLAHEMTHDDSHPLAGRPLWAVNLGALVAGTHYRGEFEARIQALLNEITGEARPIVFLDEVHLLLGAGRAEGMTMDAANLLKPVLARDEARVIGATTSDEYRLIAKDAALARRFQELKLSPPQGEELLSVISAQANALAIHHQLTVPASLLPRAIALADRFLPSREQPDKTLDLLDTAAVAARRVGRETLGVEDLHHTLSRLTGLSVGQISGAGHNSLKALADTLKARVIGQDAVIERLVATLVHRRLDLRGAERLLGSFLFVGDTGVGKTELARATAACFFGSEQRLARFDLAENAASEAALHTLLGAPPGLVGSSEDGALIRALRESGERVLLFDEVEKAHPAVLRMLLGLLERGIVHSSHGEILTAQHCLVILTTNAVTGNDLHRLGGMGFSAATLPDTRELLARTFPAELLGRLDEILLFRSLNANDLSRILALRLQEALAHLHERQVCVSFDKARLLRHLLTRLQETRGGARDVQRLLEREFLVPIGTALLQADVDEGEIVLDDSYYQQGQCCVGFDATHTVTHTNLASAKP